MNQKFALAVGLATITAGAVEARDELMLQGGDFLRFEECQISPSILQASIETGYTLTPIRGISDRSFQMGTTQINIWPAIRAENTGDQISPLHETPELLKTLIAEYENYYGANPFAASSVHKEVDFINIVVLNDYDESGQPASLSNSVTDTFSCPDPEGGNTQIVTLKLSSLHLMKQAIDSRTNWLSMPDTDLQGLFTGYTGVLEEINHFHQRLSLPRGLDTNHGDIVEYLQQAQDLLFLGSFDSSFAKIGYGSNFRLIGRLDDVRIGVNSLGAMEANRGGGEAYSMGTLVGYYLLDRGWSLQNWLDFQNYLFPKLRELNAEEKTFSNYLELNNYLVSQINDFAFENDLRGLTTTEFVEFLLSQDGGETNWGGAVKKLISATYPVEIKAGFGKDYWDLVMDFSEYMWAFHRFSVAEQVHLQASADALVYSIDQGAFISIPANTELTLDKGIYLVVPTYTEESEARIRFSNESEKSFSLVDATPGFLEELESDLGDSFAGTHFAVPVGVLHSRFGVVSLQKEGKDKFILSGPGGNSVFGIYYKSRNESEYLIVHGNELNLLLGLWVSDTGLEENAVIYKLPEKEITTLEKGTPVLKNVTTSYGFSVDFYKQNTASRNTFLISANLIDRLFEAGFKTSQSAVSSTGSIHKFLHSPERKTISYFEYTDPRGFKYIAFSPEQFQEQVYPYLEDGETLYQVPSYQELTESIFATIQEDPNWPLLQDYFILTDYNTLSLGILPSDVASQVRQASPTSLAIQVNGTERLIPGRIFFIDGLAVATSPYLNYIQSGKQLYLPPVKLDWQLYRTDLSPAEVQAMSDNAFLKMSPIVRDELFSFGNNPVVIAIELNGNVAAAKELGKLVAITNSSDKSNKIRFVQEGGQALMYISRMLSPEEKFKFYLKLSEIGRFSWPTSIMRVNNATSIAPEEWAAIEAEIKSISPMFEMNRRDISVLSFPEEWSWVSRYLHMQLDPKGLPMVSFAGGQLEPGIVFHLNGRVYMINEAKNTIRSLKIAMESVRGPSYSNKEK